LLPKDSWINDPAEGGGRIRGEVCHFVDLVHYLVGSDPVQVYAQSADVETVVTSLQFADGSIATIIYGTAGDPLSSKERIEMIGASRTAIVEDFRKLTLSGCGREKTYRKFIRDKGHRGELAAFVGAVRTHGMSPIPFQEVKLTTLATLKILESLTIGKPVHLESGNA
jgi:predicted dehydrogenase